jgi:hypothetical protein
MRSEVQSRTFNIPSSLFNVTRYEFTSAGSASTLDLDLTPRDSTSASTFVQNQERANLAAAALFGGVAFVLANDLSATYSVADVLTIMAPCVINLISLFSFLAVVTYFTFSQRSLKQFLGSDVVWTVDP